MDIVLYVIAIVGIVWGETVRRTSRTMSSGPREGTMFGGLVFAAVGGALIAGVASLFGSSVSVGAFLITAFYGIGFAFIGFMVPFMIAQAFGKR